MSMIGSIAALSMDMKAGETSAAVQVAMLKKAMNTEQAAVVQLLQGLEAAAPPPAGSPGHLVDVIA